MDVGIFDRKWIEENLDTLPIWQQSAYMDFANTIADEENTFPCVPARMGFLSNHLRYSFIGDPRKEQSIHELAHCLKEFTKSSQTFGKYTTLTVFFHTPQDMLGNYKVEDYQQLFWTILNQLTNIDDLDWPEQIPTDPHTMNGSFVLTVSPILSPAQHPHIKCAGVAISLLCSWPFSHAGFLKK